MIPKLAVGRFLKAPRDDCRTLKEQSPAELRALMRDLPAKPPIWKKLHHHQRVCFLAGAHHERFAFFNDPGTGKTLLSIALARYFRRASGARRALVLVPTKIARSEWLDELDKHSPSTPRQVLRAGHALRDDVFFALMTYQGFARMVSVRALNKKGDTVLKLDPKNLKAAADLFDIVIMDESQHLGHHQSLQHRAVRAIAKRAKVAFALTGTPLNRDPEMLWAQMKIIDNGASLGATLGLFRAAFYTEADNRFGGVDYEYKTSMDAMLHRLLAHRSIRYEADKASLPPVVPIIKRVKLPASTWSYYSKFQKVMDEARGDRQAQQNAFLRLRQISSGWLGYNDDETGVRAEIEFTPNPKLELLLAILDSINHKVVIFTQFVFSGSIIARELDRIGTKYARIYGQTRDPNAELHRFKHDPECKVFLNSNSAGATSLNLQMAKYLIFYESPVAPIVRTQAERRVERQGSVHDRVFRYDLVTLGTEDQHILASLAEGRDRFEAIVDGRQK